MNYNSNTQYPNLNEVSYNYNSNVNTIPPQNINQVTYTNDMKCQQCLGNGWYILNGVKQPCVCIEKANCVHKPKKKNILSRAWDSVVNSVTVGAKEFSNTWNKSKYCIDCVRTTGYCPKCNNSGYKTTNNKQCKCKLT
jgi:hypothetical protein